MYNYFSNHFMATETVRPCVDGLVFCRINHGEGVNLVRPFTIDKVKAAV